VAFNRISRSCDSGLVEIDRDRRRVRIQARKYSPLVNAPSLLTRAGTNSPASACICEAATRHQQGSAGWRDILESISRYVTFQWRDNARIANRIFLTQRGSSRQRTLIGATSRLTIVNAAVSPEQGTRESRASVANTNTVYGIKIKSRKRVSNESRAARCNVPVFECWEIFAATRGNNGAKFHLTAAASRAINQPV